jgi:hypothetical protein
MVLRSFKSFSLPYTIINFLFASLKLLTNFKNAYWNPPKNFLLCNWSMCSSADLSLVAGKMREYYFTESQAASCKHFHCKNPRFRVFEVGYWKDFQN